MNAPDLHLPWRPLDPDPHGGILACVVSDAAMGHVGVFASATQALAVCETMNRAAGLETERDELAAELAACSSDPDALRPCSCEESERLRALLEASRKETGKAIDQCEELRAQLAELREEHASTRAGGGLSVSSTESQRLYRITQNAFPGAGCTDGGCIFGHPGGMQTNGGCECLKGNSAELARNLRKLARIARLALARTEGKP